MEIVPGIIPEVGGTEAAIQGDSLNFRYLNKTVHYLELIYFFSNLNGQYLNGPVPLEFEYKGMYWYDYQGPLYSLMKSKMMIRPYSNAIGSTNSQSGTTVKPRSAQVPAPPSNLSRPTLGPKTNQQGQMKLKKKKDID